MKIATSLGFCLALTFALTACSHSHSAPGGGGETGSQTPQGNTGLHGVTKVQAIIQIDMDGNISVLDKANAQIPINIVNPSDVRFTVSTASFKMPAITNAL